VLKNRKKFLSRPKYCTPTERQVSKRQVSKRQVSKRSVSKRLVSKRQFYKMLGLQNTPQVSKRLVSKCP
jgi:hypothetical protein